ncbi:MAG: hypothetical protein ACT4P2_03060 [Pseudomonadota bacterium]
MKPTRKFLFETIFRPDRAGTAGVTVAARPLNRSYTPAEFEAAAAAAFANGRDAGRAEAAAEAERLAAAALPAIAERLAALVGETERRLSDHARLAVHAAGTIAGRLLPALAAREGLVEIEAAVGECLSRLHDEPRIVIRVSEATLDPLRGRLDALASAHGFAGRIVLIAEAALAPLDVRVEWADGGLERDTARTRREIDAVIQRFVTTIGANPPRP